MAFDLIYWTPICDNYFLKGSILEKCGQLWENGRFSGRLRPDWGSTAWAATAGLGYKGYCTNYQQSVLEFPFNCLK